MRTNYDNEYSKIRSLILHYHRGKIISVGKILRHSDAVDWVMSLDDNTVMQHAIEIQGKTSRLPSAKRIAVYVKASIIIETRTKIIANPAISSCAFLLFFSIFFLFCILIPHKQFS